MCENHFDDLSPFGIICFINGYQRGNKAIRCVSFWIMKNVLFRDVMLVDTSYERWQNWIETKKIKNK